MLIQLLKGQTPDIQKKKKKKIGTTIQVNPQHRRKVHKFTANYVFFTALLYLESKYLVHFSDTNTAVYRITALSL